MNIHLQPPRRYFPVSRNAFAFTAGLNTIKDNEKILLIDTDYSNYIQNKIHNREKSYGRFVQKHQLDTQIENASIQFLLDQITQDWPDYFKVEQQRKNIRLRNNITAEILTFDQNMRLVDSKNDNYNDALDALLTQIQEDISITVLNQDSDSIRYLHLCFPNFWSAEDKIGKNFIDAHKAVPDMGKIKQSHIAINRMLMTSGPFERFTWGLTTNKNLSQHPHDNNSTSRQFDLAENIYMRVERQVTVPLPTQNAYIFFIRTYFENIQDLNIEETTRLIHSLNSMSEETASYKGMANQRDNIIRRLNYN